MKHSFVCVGFPKCATTTLDAILRQHPQIALPCIKEPIFFSRYDLYRRGIQWYEKRYYGHSKKKYLNKIVGEINPRNTSSGNYEKNILETFGQETKLIYIIRNPVDAVFSDFKMQMEGAAVYPKYKDNILTESSFDEFVDRGLFSRKRFLFAIFMYGRHIATALKYAPAQNICVVLFEDLIEDIEGVTKKILTFIGADVDVPINYDIKENVGDRISKGEKALKISRKKYKFWRSIYIPYFPYMGERIERMMDAWFWNIRIKATVPVEEGAKKIGIHEETRKKLMEYYRSDVELLDEVLKTDYGKRWGFVRNI